MHSVLGAIRAALAVAWGLLALWPVPCAGDPLVELEGRTMGTGYSVLVCAEAGLPPRADLARGVEAILARIDAELSTWRDDSELARFNAARSTGWISVSPETAAVAVAALSVSRRTGGAFDPTVAPLVELWGFGRRPSLAEPDPEALARTRARVGYAALTAREVPPALRKARADLELDLSAIAKGRAVDALAEFLADQGARHFLVEIGGELRARSGRPDGRPWRVAVEAPEEDGAEPRAWAVLALADAALATSGDYRRTLEQDGVLRSHILDPRVGEPVGHDLASASVVADTAMQADALATALLVLGSRAGLRLAEEEGWAVLLIERRDGRLVEHTSTAFDRLTRIDRPPLARAGG